MNPNRVLFVSACAAALVSMAVLIATDQSAAISTVLLAMALSEQPPLDAAGVFGLAALAVVSLDWQPPGLSGSFLAPQAIAADEPATKRKGKVSLIDPVNLVFEVDSIGRVWHFSALAPPPLGAQPYDRTTFELALHSSRACQEFARGQGALPVVSWYGSAAVRKGRVRLVSYFGFDNSGTMAHALTPKDSRDLLSLLFEAGRDLEASLVR